MAIANKGRVKFFHQLTSANIVHTNNNAFTQSSRISGGDYYDYTLTLGVKITEELVWRGEGRFAWGAGTTHSADASVDYLQEPLSPPASNSLWTLATEIYYRF